MQNLINNIWQELVLNMSPKAGQLCNASMGKYGNTFVKCEDTASYIYWHNQNPIIGILLILAVFIIFLTIWIKGLVAVIKNETGNKRVKWILMIIFLNLLGYWMYHSMKVKERTDKWWSEHVNK
jgi:hypothetical protein